MNELNEMKTHLDMVQGKATGILSTAITQVLQKTADKMGTLLGENQKLKKQLEDTEKLVPKEKRIPRPDMPSKETDKKVRRN